MMILQQDTKGATPNQLAEREARAYEWFHKASEQGHPNAMVQLGFLYEKGIRVSKKQIILERNIPEAAKWYQEAADGEHNNDNGQNSLGLLFYKGLISQREIEMMRESMRLP